MLLRLLSDASLDINDPNVKFVKPSLRLGMIPTGSTDALVFATNGTTDVQTAAVHIILGELSRTICEGFFSYKKQMPLLINVII